MVARLKLKVFDGRASPGVERVVWSLDFEARIMFALSRRGKWTNTGSLVIMGGVNMILQKNIIR
jgi:hypothetical protein